MRRPTPLAIAGAIVLACLVGALIYLVLRLSDSDERMTRIAGPSIAQFGLAKPGTYTIYHEKKAVVDGVYYASESVAGLKLVLTSLATGAEVKLGEPGIGASFAPDDRTGTPIYAFTIEQPGRYRLVTSAPVAVLQPPAVLAIGYDKVGSVLGTTGGVIAVIVAAASLLGALVLAGRWRRKSLARSYVRR
jgi:hypothetical protein